MFCGSYSLKDLDLASFDTVNVKSMNGMFQACAALESINLSGFDTSGVTNMLQMFEFCGNLKSLDLSSFDTSNVTHMNNMFLACMSLGALDLSNFDTLRVTEMGGMFSRCRALKTLSLSNFDTSKVTSMWDMFANCDSLVSVDLSSFDTANVTSMARMFENCPSLTALDLSGFNTSNLSEGDGYLSGTADMFSGCDSLGVIILGAKVSKLGTLPSTDSYGLAQWKSQATGEWYTAAQVIDGRLGIADSYTRGVQYKMLDLSVESYSPGASGGVTIRFDGPFELFTKLVINGVEVPKDKYTARSGSTVVELSDSYLSGLSTGEQEVTALYSNGGSATTSFEIAEATDPDPAPSPKPDDPKPVDPKPDTPGTDDPGTTDKPSTDKPGTDGPGTADPKPDDADKPGVTDPEPVATQVMYRAYNPNSGEHFYTAHYAEIESIVAAGWLYEGEAWTAPVTSATPVYRLYSGTDHHYTTSTVERDHLISVGWSDEGIGWYSDDNQGMGLHRLFNPNVDPSAPINNSGSHHYTTSDVERDHLVSIGWRYEDFGWYGVK